MRFTISCGTRRNTHYDDKPNEDFYVADEGRGIVILLDGVTRDRVNGAYPAPSPARVVSELFAAAAMKALCANEEEPNQALRLKLAAQAGNTAVAKANECFDDPFLPGTVGVMAIFKGDCLHYAYIGDSNCIVLSGGNAEYFTVPQTAEVHRRSKEFTALEIRTKICNNAEHPCGYGVWNGQKESESFLRTGTVKLKAGDKVLICSDGIDPFLSTVSAKDLCHMGGEEIIEAAMDYTKPQGWMDDRTAVAITVQCAERA